MAFFLILQNLKLYIFYKNAYFPTQKSNYITLSFKQTDPS